MNWKKRYEKELIGTSENGTKLYKNGYYVMDGEVILGNGYMVNYSCYINKINDIKGSKIWFNNKTTPGKAYTFSAYTDDIIRKATPEEIKLMKKHLKESD